MTFGISTSRSDTGGDTEEDGFGGKSVPHRSKANRCRRMISLHVRLLLRYTSHGHAACCANTVVDNDATLASLGKQAVIAAAGAILLRPPRQWMDKSGYPPGAGCRRFYRYGNNVLLTKFASSFYGPFREAAGTALKATAKRIK